MFVIIFLLFGYVEKIFELEVEGFLILEVFLGIINREIVLNGCEVWMIVF